MWRKWKARRREEEAKLHEAEQRLTRESEVDEHVEKVVSRIEEIQERNHFGEALERSFRRRWA